MKAPHSGARLTYNQMIVNFIVVATIGTLSYVNACWRTQSVRLAHVVPRKTKPRQTRPSGTFGHGRPALDQTLEDQTARRAWGAHTPNRAAFRAIG